MRRILRATISLGAATAAMLALGGASLPAAAVQPDVLKPNFSIPAYHAVAPKLTDAQLVAAAAPARAHLAAVARAKAAAAAAARRAASRSGIGRASYSGGGTINVWTTGFQTQVNECRGGVDLTGAYHTRTVGEHWSCGGASFPESAGSLVTFTGLDAGTYKVLGVAATLNAYTAHTRDIPHGYQMLFQTCRNGDSHTTIFIALEKVG